MGIEDLVTALTDDVTALTALLESGEQTADAWFVEMAQTLTDHHMAAMMTGLGSAALPPAAQAALGKLVAAQLSYLDNFRLVIKDAAAFERGWTARAQMYAEAIRAPYWSGRTKMLPLPFLPGDGTTQCLSRCRCAWEVETINEAQGDYDARWVLGDAEHCQTCIARTGQNPYRIRGGELL